jgi:hypothetical protein
MFGSLLGGLLGGIGGLFGGDATKKAAKANGKALDNYQTQGTAAIDAGNTAASGYLGDVSNLWKGLADESGGLSGLKLYGDALGINGATGNANATASFKAGPGYEYQLGQGLDALERRAGAQGRLSSGQTGLDTINYAEGLANNEWSNWLQNLSGFGQQQSNIYTGAIGGQAGAKSDLASLATNTAGQKVDLLGNITNGRMGVNNQKAEGTQQQLSGLGGLGKGVGALFGGYL